MNYREKGLAAEVSRQGHANHVLRPPLGPSLLTLHIIKGNHQQEILPCRIKDSLVAI